MLWVMNKILEKGETIKTIISLVELEKVQEAGCDELFGPTSTGSEGTSWVLHEGQPHTICQQKQGSKEWRVQSWTKRAALCLCSTTAPVCVHTCPRGVRSRRDRKEPGNACNSYFCMLREGTADWTLLQGVAKNPLSVLNAVKCSH